MPWIKPIKQNSLKEMNVYNEMEQPVPIFNRLLANSPEVLEAFLPLQKAIKETFLSDLYREAIITYVSYLNGCKYCTEGHSSLLDDLMNEDDVLEKLINFELSDLDESLKVVLSYAQKLVSKPVSVTKEDIDALKGLGYTDQQITEINHVIAYTSFTNQISIGLGL